MNLWRRIYLERRAVALPLLVVLLGNVAVLALVVFPLQRTVDGAISGEVDAKTQMANAQVLDKSAKDSRAKKDQADQELQKFYTEVLPHSFNDARQMASFWLQRTAAQAGLALKNIVLDPEAVRDSRLQRLKGKVTLSGDYTNLRRFLYAVETAQQFLIIEKVGVSQPSQLQNVSGALEITMDVATYFLGAGDRTAGGQ